MFFPILTRAFSLAFCSVSDHAEKFDSDVSKWDVGKVSNMYASKYSFLPPLSRRRLPPIVSILTRVPFSPRSVPHAYQFNSDVSKWNVAKVSTMFGSKYSFLPPLSRRRLPPHSFQS